MSEVVYKVNLPAFTRRNVPIKEIASAIGKDEIQHEIKAHNRTETVEPMGVNIEAMVRDLQKILRISAEQNRLWEAYEGR
ncbi:MAG: hypothetical protein HFJ09_05285 [Lachnospiraceae bacterium]|nr:hypothetical protein [Lachnospiraceae bacterium]